MPTLYNYFRSSAAYRVRIALNLKGLAYDSVYVHLPSGKQKAADYAALNPQQLVPFWDDGEVQVGQSLAILEYLDEAHPTPPLLPKSPAAKAQTRAIALSIACEIHPLNNLRVLKHLSAAFGASDEQKNTWYRHWVNEGFVALEALLARSSGMFCVGDAPSIADCYLVPQVFNARRFNVDLAPYPTIARIDAHCATLPAFQAAHPSQQADAE